MGYYKISKKAEVNPRILHVFRKYRSILDEFEDGNYGTREGLLARDLSVDLVVPNQNSLLLRSNALPEQWDPVRTALKIDEELQREGFETGYKFSLEKGYLHIFNLVYDPNIGSELQFDPSPWCCSDFTLGKSAPFNLKMNLDEVIINSNMGSLVSLKKLSDGRFMQTSLHAFYSPQIGGYVLTLASDLSAGFNDSYQDGIAVHIIVKDPRKLERTRKNFKEGAWRRNPKGALEVLTHRNAIIIDVISPVKGERDKSIEYLAKLGEMSEERLWLAQEVASNLDVLTNVLFQLKGTIIADAVPYFVDLPTGFIFGLN